MNTTNVSPGNYYDSADAFDRRICVTVRSEDDVRVSTRNSPSDVWSPWRRLIRETHRFTTNRDPGDETDA